MAVSRLYASGEDSSRGTSIAELAREAIERQLPPGPTEGRLSFFSVDDGSPGDASERVDELVGKAVARRKSGRSRSARSA